jgi:hypothetical protein
LWPTLEAEHALAVINIEMNKFESEIPNIGAPESNLESALYLQFSAMDEARRQREIVRNVFLTRKDSEPTPGPYDSIALSSGNTKEVNSAILFGAQPRSYYDGRQNTLFCNTRVERSKS